MHTKDGQPATGSPKVSVLTIINTIIIIEIKKNKIPTIDEIAKGTVEKATMLSKEYKNNFQKPICLSLNRLYTPANILLHIIYRYNNTN